IGGFSLSLSLGVSVGCGLRCSGSSGIGACRARHARAEDVAMMPRGSVLLLPVNPVFMWASLLVAFTLNLIPLGRAPAMPDCLAVAVVFWNVHQPRRVGVGVAFMFGLFMDVHQGALLGQHALTYTLLSYFAIFSHRRL